MAWTPGRHKAQVALETPYEDVPEHLFGPLLTWIEAVFYSHDVNLGFVAMKLRFDLAPNLSESAELRSFREACRRDRDFMLDLVEELLDGTADSEDTDTLGEILSGANSAYNVRDDGGALIMRVPGAVQESVRATVEEASGSAGDHLTAAWNSAYGRKHDPVKAYSESIKAVEAALAKHITPQNRLQTLGTMIKDIEAKPSKWEFVIDHGSVDGVAAVLSMMKLLWVGQTSRHGGVRPTRAETLDESRAGLHLASTLVQFGTSGYISVV